MNLFLIILNKVAERPWATPANMNKKNKAIEMVIKSQDYGGLYIIHIPMKQVDTETEQARGDTFVT